MMLHLQLTCDNHFFFTIAIYMYIIQNSMSIYFCTIYYDQKTFEFNSFKMTIFTNIWSIAMFRIIPCIVVMYLGKSL